MTEMTNQTKEVAGVDDAKEAAAVVSEDMAETGREERNRGKESDTAESSKKQKLTTTTTATDSPVPHSVFQQIPYLYNSPPPRRTNLRLGTPNFGDDPPAEGRNIMQLALDHLNIEYNARAVANPLLPRVVWEFAGGLHINAFVDNGVWCHINFRAKVVTDNPSFSIRKRGPYLIFGELRRIRRQGVFEVVICQNLGPVEFAVPRLNGCKACDMAQHRDMLMHGSKGFEVGHTLGFEG